MLPGRAASPSPGGLLALLPVLALFATLALIAALAVGCGPTPASTPAAPGSSPAASASAVASPATSGSPLVADPAARLEAALAALDDGYTFQSRVAVGSEVATTVEGRWVAGASEFVISSGGKSVSYRSVPPRAWVRETGGSWVAVDTAPPGGSPLDSLRSPRTLSTVAEEGGGTRLAATYPASQLGLSGDADVTVMLVLGADGTLEAAFATAAGGTPATSSTTFRPAAGKAPIEPPASSAP